MWLTQCPYFHLIPLLLLGPSVYWVRDYCNILSINYTYYQITTLEVRK